MPVPKRKLSRSRRDSRNANKGLKAQSFSVCAQDGCDEPKLPHVVCGKCGFYRGKKVLKTKMDRELTRADARSQAAKQAQSQEGDQK